MTTDRPRTAYDIPITDATLPWKQPPTGPYSHYADDGPHQAVTFIAAGAMMRVTPTNATGRDTGRTRYHVECLTCQEVMHHATTGSTSRVRDHLFERHGWDGAPATVVIETVAEEAPTPTTIPFEEPLIVSGSLSDGVIHDAIVAGMRTEISRAPKNVVETATGQIDAHQLAALVDSSRPAVPASTWVRDKTRPSWAEQFMLRAYVTALRGSCCRKRVGAVIVDSYNRHVADGFNGAPAKQPDCLTVGCDVRTIDGRESCVRTLHAESNALDYAGRGARDCALFTTVIPCRPCALRIIQAGILSVYYSEFYESQGTRETKALLEGAGLKLLQVELPHNELTVALRRAVGEIP